MTEKKVIVGLSGGKEIEISTGKLAKQTSGAVMVTCGGTQVLVTACGSSKPRPGTDFLPLTCDYQEKTAAAGKIPGGYFKREGRPKEAETLISRIIDRSIRPLFPEGYRCETQIIATVFSSDVEHPADTLSLIGASAALSLSELPFQGPIAGVRVCRINGEFIINPSYKQRDEEADINIFIACSEEAIMMVEGGAKEAIESDIIDALMLGHTECKKIISEIKNLCSGIAKEKNPHEVPVLDETLYAQVKELALDKIINAYKVQDKIQRYKELDKAKSETKEALFAKDESLSERAGEISEIIGDIKYNYVRHLMVDTDKRIDGRGFADIRNISCEVGILKRAHGSALFTRGETQTLVTATLGTKRDEQRIDELHNDVFNRFMLHYNFPPYSVGEARPMRSAGRRELGHGALARTALENIIDLESSPYTLRIVSDVLESNGSSSMATVCGGSLAAMDAGITLKAPVAGIAMGLVKEKGKFAILSDILGDEDHLGDMDFKVTGTETGITAIQMDIKIDGVSREILEQSLEQARQGRIHILNEMSAALTQTRESVSEWAPKIIQFKIKESKIRDVIGSGGKTIKGIAEKSGAEVNIEDSGLVTVSGVNASSAEAAKKMVEEIIQEPEVNKVYLGQVRKIVDFGAFVQIFPGTDGLLHISELAEKRVEKVEDVLQEGDEVMVKCIGFDRGKIKLSRKAVLIEEADSGTSTSAPA